MLDGAFFMIVIALPIIRLKHYFEGIYLYQELYCGHRVTFSKYLYWNSLKLHHWPASLILCTIWMLIIMSSSMQLQLCPQLVWVPAVQPRNQRGRQLHFEAVVDVALLVGAVEAGHQQPDR